MNVPSTKSRRFGPGVIAALVLVPLAALAAIYLLFFNEDSPDKFTLDTPAGDTTPSPTGAATGSLEGTWRVAEGSEAGYRVREKLAALPATSDAVGRTTVVTGALTVTGTGSQVVADGVNVEVDVSTLESDEDRRDNRIRTSGLQTDEFPTATFVSTAPVTLPAGAETGQPVETEVTGNLTIHGVTKLVTIPLQVQLIGDQGQVVGSLKFPFSDFGMTPPSIGGFVSVESDATLEFNLRLARG